MTDYRPRNDVCLIQIVDIGKTETGIHLPDYAVQGKKFVVLAVGPDVQDLEPGDSVLMAGQRGIQYHELPNRSDLLVIRQEHVLLVIEEGEDEVV